MMAVGGDGYKIRGTYDDSVITVYCVEDEGKTNTILLHEAKHFIDDTTGGIEAGTADVRRSVHRILGTAAVTGVGISTALAVSNIGEPLLGAAAIVPAVSLMYRACWNAPHEVAARQFSVAPEITEVYGKIISYRQAG